MMVLANIKSEEASYGNRGGNELDETISMLNFFERRNPFEHDCSKLDFHLLCKNRNDGTICGLLSSNAATLTGKLDWDALCSNSSPSAIAFVTSPTNRYKINIAEFCKNDHPSAIDVICNVDDDSQLDFDNLSANQDTGIVHFLLQKKPHKINFCIFSGNPNPVAVAAMTSKFREFIDWSHFSSNSCATAVDFMLRPGNIHRIDWSAISGNTSDLAVGMLIDNFPLKVNFDLLSRNSSDRAVDFLTINKDRINWDVLCTNVNPRAIDFLRRHPEKIQFYNLSGNPQGSDLLVKEYSHRIHWNALSGNSSDQAFRLLRGRFDCPPSVLRTIVPRVPPPPLSLLATTYRSAHTVTAPIVPPIVPPIASTAATVAANVMKRARGRPFGSKKQNQHKTQQGTMTIKANTHCNLDRKHIYNAPVVVDTVINNCGAILPLSSNNDSFFSCSVSHACVDIDDRDAADIFEIDIASHPARE